VLTSFVANLDNRNVIIVNGKQVKKEAQPFVIERSTNGIDYDDAGVVFATGSSDVKQDYSFTDAINTLTKASFTIV